MHWCLRQALALKGVESVVIEQVSTSKRPMTDLCRALISSTCLLKNHIQYLRLDACYLAYIPT